MPGPPRPGGLIFLDASEVQADLTRLRGRVPKGQRVHAQSPRGQRNTTTILGVLRMDGSTACTTVEGVADTEVFQACVRCVLAATLRAGEWVVLDNLSSHKNELTRALTRQAGAEVLFRASAESRTQPALLEAIALARLTITRQDAINGFAGYGHINIE